MSSIMTYLQEWCKGLYYIVVTYSIPLEQYVSPVLQIDLITSFCTMHPLNETKQGIRQLRVLLV